MRKYDSNNLDDSSFDHMHKKLYKLVKFFFLKKEWWVLQNLFNGKNRLIDGNSWFLSGEAYEIMKLTPLDWSIDN